MQNFNIGEDAKPMFSFIHFTY